MDRGPSPLLVAGIAAALLVMVVAVDVAFNRTYALEIQDQDGSWTPVATSQPHHPLSLARPTLEVNASDQVPFRLVADNGLPWALSASYTVEASGRLLDQGTLTAPSMSQGTAGFTVSGQTLLGAERGPSTHGQPRYNHLGIGVTIDGQMFHGSLVFEEVSR